MEKLLKGAVQRISPSTFALLKGLRQLYGKDSYLRQVGYVHACKVGYPCRPDGSPLPWMNYGIIRFLEERLNRDCRIFEYGSGYSTLFFARLAKEVFSVEHDPAWYETVRRQTPCNATVLFCPLDYGGKYCRTIREIGGVFDLVVVDGRDRVNCMAQGSDCLAEGGVLLLDDSERERYRAGIDCLRAQGFKRLDFEGLKPLGTTLARTTLFYRPNNCLGL